MSKTMVPATEADTARVQRHLARMPFVGAQFAPHFRAVSAMPMPPLNQRGGRDAEGWTAVYEAIVQPEWINGRGGMHGAAACWIVDMITGTTLSRMRTDTWGLGGPSIAIDMTYYDPAPVRTVDELLAFLSLTLSRGTRLLITASIERMGGALGTARCVIANAETGKNIAAGLHTTMTPASATRAAQAKKVQAKL
ncbi:uncharacterized protein EHS24_008980 [Apiotrichum porosum]|uniref:Thioesterase domain-containing protein n=1 Tax=Apiotrichum porosum TaxID=105984 RepID=A0A427XNM0_9TREE|nr:uncharacterized protein EHS24_008980 [Apiotrichum porosum]RSH80403.1 hypothetical protein EHS24_008980 [Apiotrichum porosum]